MTDLFIFLFNMSITASWLVLAVVLLRFLLKKAPKWVNTVLWAFVGFRLICPISFESIFSLIPSTETIPQNITNGPSFDIHTGINIVDNQVNNYLGDHYFEGVTVPVNTGFTAVNIFTILWILGIAAMLIYSGISFIRLNVKVREGVVLKDNIWLCDGIDTPFILGLFKPRIFLPSRMSESDMEYVIAHENAHLRRRDHWWKPLGFLLLTVYWFNPVMWLAYILLCRDIELACDEKVIKEMGTDARKPYSEALINCSVSRRTISACPLAFGETGVKGRIKSVLSYKKPTLWIIIIAVISCIVVAVCFLTNPKSDLKKTNPELDKAVSQTIFEINEVTQDILEFKSGNYPKYECAAEGHIIYGIEEEGDNVTVYLQERFSGFGFKNGYFMEQTGHFTPAVYTFVKNDNSYTLINYEYPVDGEHFYQSIQELFPPAYAYRAFNVTEKDHKNLWKQCLKYAEEYLDSIGREAEIRDYSEVTHIMLTDAGVSVDVEEGLLANKSFSHYDLDIGNYETLEDGVRYVYRTAYEKDKNLIVFTTELYGEGENATNQIIEKIEINGQTGDIVSQNSYPYEIPETTPEKGKSYSSDFLDYTKAAEEVRDQYSITAIHCPSSDEVESGILIGEAYCNEVAAFLNSVNWKRSLPPIESLSSPGSVEFVIDEDYRVTVYERKKGSLFAYAVVKVGDDERYYHASYDDYKDAVALLHPPATVSEDTVEGFHSYSYITENDSAYISLNPTEKTVFFSLSRLSSFTVQGIYQDYTDKLVIIADNNENKYMFRKSGEDLIFVADESTPVPEYKYKTDGEPEVCIPDGAVFSHSGFDRYYIDKVWWDIDKDGTEEHCILGYGPTSGLFTVTFSAYENGHLEYFNIFNSNISDIQFGADKDGNLVIKGQVFADYDNIAYATYEISIKDGNIVLGSGDGMMAYWGEQGLDSPYAPK